MVIKVSDSTGVMGRKSIGANVMSSSELSLPSVWSGGASQSMRCKNVIVTLTIYFSNTLILLSQH